MAIQQAVLLIADIGGYTRFMTVHRVNLAHAQDVVAQLLEAILDAARGFQLAKLEGDAAFLYAPLASGPAELGGLGEQIAAIRRAFVERRAELARDRICTCDACTQAGDLKLKFVAHLGEVAEQRVKRNRELAGVSVITVHRMLKNHVPVPEYLLATEALFGALGPALQKLGTPLQEELEGLGTVATHYVDLDAVVREAPPRPPSTVRKLWAWLRMTWRSLPYFVGVKKACQGFRNLEAVLGPAPQAALPPSSAGPG